MKMISIQKGYTMCMEGTVVASTSQVGVYGPLHHAPALWQRMASGAHGT